MVFRVVRAVATAGHHLNHAPALPSPRPAQASRAGLFNADAAELGAVRHIVIVDVAQRLFVFQVLTVPLPLIVIVTDIQVAVHLTEVGIAANDEIDQCIVPRTRE